nr:MAG TPA: hypothetical protein [Bacteriophage sp.]
MIKTILQCDDNVTIMVAALRGDTGKTLFR